MRRVLAAVLALAFAAFGLAFLLRLQGSRSAPRSRLDPLADLSTTGPRPLSRAQLAALERYGHPSGRPAAAPPSPPPSPLAVAITDRRLIAVGEPLRTSPQPTAAVLGTVATTATVPVLSEHGGWALVRVDEQTGWVATGRLVRLGEPEAATPPLGAAIEPTLPLAAVPADPTRLARARAFLQLANTRTAHLGPWRLLTDVQDATALGFLDQVAGQVERAYRDRYGLNPVGQAQETIVLFTEDDAYRAFRRREGAATSGRTGGHATAGLAALVLGDRGTEAAAESLVHELTHLFNRRAIGPALPPWLDEGLANDLGLCRIGPDGALRLSTLSGRRRPLAESEVAIEGGEALALVVRRRLGALVPLERLLTLDSAAFLRPGLSELHYGESALFIRYLMDADGGAHRAAFRSFLQAVATGAPIDPEAFRAHLGPSWPRLQAGFESWVGLSVVP